MAGKHSSFYSFRLLAFRQIQHVLMLICTCESARDAAGLLETLASFLTLHIHSVLALLSRPSLATSVHVTWFKNECSRCQLLLGNLSLLPVPHRRSCCSIAVALICQPPLLSVRPGCKCLLSLLVCCSLVMFGVLTRLNVS